MQVSNSDSLKYILLLPLMIVMLSGCRNSLRPEEYMSWIKKEDNGLMKTKKIGDYKFRCQYKPIDYIILSELRKGEVIDQAGIDSKTKELDGMQYYDLYVGFENGDLIKSHSSSESDFYNRLYYYSFGFENDIRLVDGIDTLACELYHFERDYDLAKEKRFLLGFEKKKESKADKTLCIDSKVLGLAIVKIQIKNEDITSIPEVEYETKN